MRSRAKPSPIDPGDLSEPIAIEALARAPDGYGGETRSWAVHADEWAKVKPLFVGERHEAGAVRAVTTYSFTIHRRDDLDETMRVAWNGQSFVIRGLRIGSPLEMTMEIIADRIAGV